MVLGSPAPTSPSRPTDGINMYISSSSSSSSNTITTTTTTTTTNNNNNTIAAARGGHGTLQELAARLSGYSLQGGAV